MRKQINIKYTLSPGAFLSLEDTASSLANVSNMEKLSVENATGYRGFHLSAARGEYAAILDGTYGAYSDEGYAGYVSSILAGNDGTFEQPLALTFSVTFDATLPTICITFDRACRQYATRFELFNESTGKSIVVAENKYVTALVKTTQDFWDGTTTGKLTLLIHAWSKAHSNGRVTVLSLNYDGVYTGKDVLKCTCSENLLDANTTPQPGMCEQYADVEIYDRDNVLHTIKELEDADVDIYDVTDAGELIDQGGYKITDPQIDDMSASVKFSCKDVSSTFDRVNIPALSIADRSAHDLFTLAFSYAGNIPWRYYSKYYEGVCKDTITPDCWAYASNLQEFLHKICTLSDMRVYYHKRTFVVVGAVNLPYNAERMTLTPRVYKPQAKLSLSSDCRIDTVYMQPIDNTLDDEDTVLHTEKVAEVYVNNSKVSLPLSDTTPSTHWRYLHNNSNVSLVSYEYAKSRMECVMASGSVTVKLDRAFKGTPTARINLQGTTNASERGALTYDATPTSANLGSSGYNLTNWIKQKTTTKADTLTWEYGNETVSLNPWVRNVVTDLSTTDADVLTDWAKEISLRSCAVLNGWYGETSFSKDAPYFVMKPPSSYLSIRMQNLSLSKVCTVTKVNDYTFNVSWTAPVRVTYFAASRSRGAFGGGQDLDNWAFVDNITQVSIELVGKELSDESIELSYSYDDADDLTSTALKNKYPVSIEKCELFTRHSKLGSHDLAREKAALRLDYYDHPVQVFTCSVSALWAIKNKITVGNSFQILHLNGEPVKNYRGSVSTFILTNIEKRFSSSADEYDLKLLERVL